jgi:hypothetical protein
MRNILWAGILLVAALEPVSARGGMIVRRTREDGANAIRLGAHKLTLDDLLDIRAAKPGWFAEHNPRLDRALDLGKTALIDRRAENPRRFDHYHPFLGYLLADPDRDEPLVINDIDPGPPPVTTPPDSLVPPPPPPGDPGGDTPEPPPVPAVPEPAAWVGMAWMIAAAGCYLRMRRRSLIRSRGPLEPARA